MATRTKLYRTPIGGLMLAADEEGLCLCRWVDCDNPEIVEQSAEGCPNSHDARTASYSILEQTAHELDEYFSGSRITFDIRLHPQGTEFQQKVWQALDRIEYGTTMSYSELAQEIGNIKAVRAVAQACRRNPLAVVVACHRVIGAGGQLTGYAGGIRRKEWLLQMEHNRNS
ncbi:MAG: methylated-DNA--[protein]-cysteine S-methyltransferase [Prevotella sp.]